VIHDVVEAFGATVVDVQVDRGEDAVTVAADRLGGLEEALGSGGRSI